MVSGKFYCECPLYLRHPLNIFFFPCHVITLGSPALVSAGSLPPPPLIDVVVPGFSPLAWLWLKLDKITVLSSQLDLDLDLDLDPLQLDVGPSS